MADITEVRSSSGKAEALDGWRLHPNAVRVCIVMMLIASATAFFGDSLPTLVKVVLSAPGVCAAAILTLQHAAIWQRQK